MTRPPLLLQGAQMPCQQTQTGTAADGAAPQPLLTHYYLAAR